MTFKPEVVTNKKGASVAKALSGYWQGLLDGMKEAPDLAISTAYFNPAASGCSRTSWSGPGACG